MGMLHVDLLPILLRIGFVVDLSLIFLDTLQLVVVLLGVHLHIWFVCVILLHYCRRLQLALLLYVNFVDVRSCCH